MKIMHITSGEYSADALRERLPDAEILPFNEAMCEGEAALPVFGEEFCRLRAKAYGVRYDEYLQKSPVAGLKKSGGYGCLELYFDHDMFCAVNAVTLLAYLEQSGFGGKILFHLIAQDGRADVLESAPIRADGYLAHYRALLLDRRAVRTGFDIFDRVLPLYLEYKKKDNEIVRYAREHRSEEKETLIKKMLAAFRDYGLSDLAAERFIGQTEIK